MQTYGLPRGGLGAGDPVTAKRRGLQITRNKDGRWSFAISCAATLSPLKVFLLLIVLLACAGFLAAPLFGEERMRQRVVDLEKRLAKRLSWVLRNKHHLASDEGVAAHLGEAEGDGGNASNSNDEQQKENDQQEEAQAPPPARKWNDGRQHLLTAPGQISKLGEAAAQLLPEHTALRSFDDHYLCGNAENGPFGPVTEERVMKLKLGLAVVSYRAPLSLAHSLESWQRQGLLDIADEKMIFLNSPVPKDFELAKQYGFDVYTSHDARVVGPSLAYLNGNSSSDILLMLEKDFPLIESVTKEQLVRELYTGVQALARGVDVYRLRGKSDWPAEGMPDCCNRANEVPHPCPYHSNWKSGGGFGDHQNWLLMFCDPDVLNNSNGRLVQCE